MLQSMFGKSRGNLASNVAARGYHVAYREDQVNHCPGCGRSHWYVGRLSAECGFCGTALPLVGAITVGAGLFRGRVRRDEEFATAA